MMDSVVRHWLTLVIGDDPALQEGLGMTVAEKLAAFYADDGLLSSTNAPWLQQALTVLVDVFKRIGLSTNAAKTKTMVCYPAARRVELSEEAYNYRNTGIGRSYQERQRAPVRCPYCDARLQANTLTSHLNSRHGVDHVQRTTPVIQPTPMTFHINWPPTLATKACPYPTCTSTLTSHYALRKHFAERHPRDQLCIRQEGSVPLARCPKCCMHVGFRALNRRHIDSGICLRLQHRHHLQQQATAIQHAREITFQVDGTPLDTVDYFKYLGRIMAASNNDWPAFHKNPQKAKEKWALIARPLLKTGVAPRVVGMFCKAIVQAVLLYGCETWVITPKLLKALEGFHHRMARRISNMMPKRQANGDWYYPPIDKALEKAGLWTMKHYAHTRQSRFAQYVATRPILDRCHFEVDPDTAASSR